MLRAICHDSTTFPRRMSVDVVTNAARTRPAISPMIRGFKLPDTGAFGVSAGDQKAEFSLLGKLNQFNGNYVDAEMVKAFLVAGEYRQRFVQ